MSAPKAKLKWGRRGWERLEPKAEPVNHFVSAIYNLNERLTRVEQALANLTNQAAPPKRVRAKKSAD